mmetsp:Transcript_73516/g.201909  ORF Transcript_73516/g.201909 Transcript_73516/m.201909 type:complete len:236 (+) Transcript_73516:159-866(+)
MRILAVGMKYACVPNVCSTASLTVAECISSAITRARSSSLRSFWNAFEMPSARSMEIDASSWQSGALSRLPHSTKPAFVISDAHAFRIGRAFAAAVQLPLCLSPLGFCAAPPPAAPLAAVAAAALDRGCGSIGPRYASCSLSRSRCFDSRAERRGCRASSSSCQRAASSTAIKNDARWRFFFLSPSATFGSVHVGCDAYSRTFSGATSACWPRHAKKRTWKVLSAVAFATTGHHG